MFWHTVIMASVERKYTCCGGVWINAYFSQNKYLGLTLNIKDLLFGLAGNTV